jgi:HEAT repeat protein
MRDAFLIRLNQLDSSYLILLLVVGAGLAAGALFYTGVLGWIIGGVGRLLGGCIRKGFQLWELLFGWATLPIFLGIVLGWLALGWIASWFFPLLTIVCALIPIFMGVTACLAYMFIDLERYEVARGHKAVHNPLKGQGLADYLMRYGHQVGVPLLAAASFGMIGGFALLNLGLYESIGESWYVVDEGRERAAYVDFLAYAFIHLLRIVDVLNLARSNQLLQLSYVHQAHWQASILMTIFQTFFTFVLLQQIFASIRQGNLLFETITDFWSPHESIHERARNALPQYGVRAIGPLLLSLRSVACLTKEQRDQLPAILAAIGPSAIPALIGHLHDPHEDMRALAVAALGHLHTHDELSLLVPLLIELAHDPSDLVRQNLAETLGLIGAANADPDRTGRRRCRTLRIRVRWMRRWFYWRAGRSGDPSAASSAQAAGKPIELAVLTLRAALSDTSAAVRTHAARSLGRIGLLAAAATPNLIALLKDADETVRCDSAESLAKVVVSGQRPADDATTHEPAVDALIALLNDAAPAVKASAARALGTLKKTAAPAVLGLVPLLQDQNESVRTDAAEAISKIGSLNEAAADSLVEGLSSPDNVVRAQTAEALGTIGTPAQDTASALVEAVADPNDRVRAKAVEALGKIGESAAELAVPSLVRALRDQDNWVSALAAEALGQMGDSADEAIPALMRALQHINPQVRSNAAESLGKMGTTALRARRALENVCQDDDGAVRAQAVRALGALGPSKSSWPVGLTALQDVDPQVRTAAVEAVSHWGEVDDHGQSTPVDYETILLPLLEDANDQVKMQTARALPKLAGATAAVVEGLCRRLLEDDSVLVQCSVAQALSKLGPAAAAFNVGGPLLRAAQTMETTVREQAMRAIAMIQPAEAEKAFASGLKDADGEIRKMASAGWMKRAAIPEDVIPALVEALRDPEVQVRANAAHALARLDELPTDAIPLLIACTADTNDGLRINAALALKLATGAAVTEAMEVLLEDANLRIRFIAASALLPSNPGHTRAGAVLVEALNDATLRLRQAALGLAQSLGAGGVVYLDALRLRAGLEEDPELQEALVQLVGQLEHQIPAEAQEVVGK